MKRSRRMTFLFGCAGLLFVAPFRASDNIYIFFSFMTLQFTFSGILQVVSIMYIQESVPSWAWEKIGPIFNVANAFMIFLGSLCAFLIP